MIIFLISAFLDFYDHYCTSFADAVISGIVEKISLMPVPLDVFQNLFIILGISIEVRSIATICSIIVSARCAYFIIKVGKASIIAQKQQCYKKQMHLHHSKQAKTPAYAHPFVTKEILLNPASLTLFKIYITLS